LDDELLLPLNVPSQSEDPVKMRKLDDPITSHKFAQLFAVAALIYEMLKTGRTMSLRDLYYTLKHIFQSQSESNLCITELGSLLKLKRHEMNLYPTAKGFVAGSLKFRFSTQSDLCDPQALTELHGCLDDAVLISSNWTRYAQQLIAGTSDDCSNEDDLLSQNENDSYQSVSMSQLSSMSMSQSSSLSIVQKQNKTKSDRDLELVMQIGEDTKYVLVIEKEGVFTRLVEERFFLKVPCIMITGCGFPDIATRALVSTLTKFFPNLRVLGLSDYNPFGCSIMLTYKFDSKTSSYEGQGLSVDTLYWIGLRTHHVQTMQEKEDFSEEWLQSYTKADRACAKGLIQSLRKRYDDDPTVAVEPYIRELHAMQSFGKKCEIEVLYSLGIHALSDFVEEKMLWGDVI